METPALEFEDFTFISIPKPSSLEEARYSHPQDVFPDDVFDSGATQAGGASCLSAFVLNMNEDFDDFTRSIGANPPRSAIDFMNDHTNYPSSLELHGAEVGGNELNEITLQPRPNRENRHHHVPCIKLSREKLRELGQKYDLRNAARWLVSSTVATTRSAVNLMFLLRFLSWRL